jgi:Flp pilus assembly protein TadD
VGILGSVGSWGPAQVQGAQAKVLGGHLSLQEQPKGVTADESLSRAWSSYEQGRFREAQELFSRAIALADPDSADEARLGLAYALIELGEPQAEEVLQSLVDKDYRLSETLPALIRLKKAKSKWEQALKLTERLEEPARTRLRTEVLKARLSSLSPDSEAFITAGREILEHHPDLRSLRLQLAWACYNLQRYECAEDQFRRLTGEAPQDPEVAQGLGWSLYKQGHFSQAAEAFEKAHSLQPSPKTAENLLLALDKAQDSDMASGVLRTWRGSSDPDIRKVAARRYRQWRLPVLADQAHPGEGACFSGCSLPWLEAGLQASHREAEEGFVGLDQVRMPISLNVPQEFGRVWTLSLTPLRLDTGSTGRTPFAGSYFNFLETGEVGRGLEERLTALEPRVGVHLEGRPMLEFELGLTPVEGPVDPLPTFSLRAHVPDAWSLTFHQCSVQDSFLSYVGQQDPYSGDTWGRVLKTGLLASRTFDMTDDLWLSLEAGGHYIWGENVVDNTSVSGTMSFGQTRPLAAGDLNYGLFATARHFERNSDFFTIGHGGYFSPDIFWMTGPFVRWTTKLCSDSWVDVQLGGGYFDYSTEEADFYPEADEDPEELTSQSARENRVGRYEADDESGWGVNAAVQGWHRLSDHVAFGGFASLNTTSKYEEWQLGLSLRFTLSPRTALCPPLDLVGGSKPCR